MKVGGGVMLLLIIGSLLLGQDLTQFVRVFEPDASAPVPQERPRTAGEDEAAQFVSVVLADTEDTWGTLFRNAGSRYQQPKLVLYTDGVESACGLNSAATGPFYCPRDQRVYLDLGFLSQLRRMGASGDFAVAYVIAHEIGHHVQNIVGTERRFRELQSRARSQADVNVLSVLMELQADCYAGVWAHHAQQQRNILEEGDIEEGINAAAAVGDDRLQRSAGQRVNPDAFTHGSSQQRAQWFRVGLQKGDIQACDTFGSVG
jgi:predicted metalloprotease